MRGGLGGEIFLLVLAWAGISHARMVVRACTVLKAEQATSEAGSTTDTARIQSSLSECSPGKAVVLETSPGKGVFISAPLVLPRGVTLFLGRGVTLYASRNPKDYDLRPGS